ncbi:MAG: M14 family zinc carboxypeptidase [Pseudonocardia sp.]
MVEVESALQVVAATHPRTTELVTLPHRTWENRVCRAVRVAADLATARPTVVLVAGVHAREWGGPDILVSFLERLTTAAAAGASISLPGYTVSVEQVERMVSSLDIVVFPQVNPDGRAYSMSPEGDEMWRTNRRPSPAGGVDVNRNHDWLWDFRRHFDPRALARGEVSVSDTPGQDTYHGPDALSEPETRNVVWLVDRYPTTRFLTDVHSFSELILHPWGDDDNQSTEPEQNFHNPAFDRRRGLLAQNGHPDADRYREYLDPEHRRALVAIGERMRDAVGSVNGRRYTVQQGAQLYGTAGTADDWAFARHALDPSRPVIYPYTIEFGREHPGDVAASFHPPYAEMATIIDEVVAGLAELCLAGLDRLAAEQRP